MNSDLFTSYEWKKTTQHIPEQKISILRRLFANFEMMRNRDIEEGEDDLETEGLPSDVGDVV